MSNLERIVLVLFIFTGAFFWTYQILKIALLILGSIED